MSKTAFQLNRREAVRLDRALRDSIAIEKKSAGETVMRMAIAIAQSGRARTKLGKKFREIRQNPEWKPRSKETRYLIVRKLQPSGERLLPKRNKKKAGDARVKIGNRGLAKSAWTWGLRKLGKGGGKTHAKRAGRFVRVTKRLTTTKPSVLLRIALEYISKVHPGIERSAIVAATNKILKVQEKKLQKQLKRHLSK